MIIETPPTELSVVLRARPVPCCRCPRILHPGVKAAKFMRRKKYGARLVNLAPAWLCARCFTLLGLAGTPSCTSDTE